MVAAGCVDPNPMLVITASPIDNNAATLEAQIVDPATQADIVPALTLSPGAGGFGMVARFVFILPDAVIGQLRINVSVHDASGCVLSRGSTQVTIAMHQRIDLPVTLAAASPSCGNPQPRADGGT
jgi:hypothetical protein